MNSPFCFYSFIFTKFDRVRQILYNIERKNMERGMSMMKSSVKKIGALVAAAVRYVLYLLDVVVLNMILPLLMVH